MTMEQKSSSTCLEEVFDQLSLQTPWLDNCINLDFPYLANIQYFLVDDLLSSTLVQVARLENIHGLSLEQALRLWRDWDVWSRLHPFSQIWKTKHSWSFFSQQRNKFEIMIDQRASQQIQPSGNRLNLYNIFVTKDASHVFLSSTRKKNNSSWFIQLLAQTYSLLQSFETVYLS